MTPCRFFIYSKKIENNDSLIQKIREALVKASFCYDEKDPELIIVCGGDGSLLRAAHETSIEGNKHVRYVLVNTGHLGFYADFDQDNVEKFLSCLINEEPIIEDLPLFTIRNDKESFDFINDVAIQSGETVFMNVYVNDELLTESRCNGIVVATPVGTTGFLTSLGSPVVIHGTNVYQFSLLAPCFNRMYINPINKAILGSDQVLKVEIKEGEYDIYIDGKKRHEVKGNTFTFIHQKDSQLPLLHFKEVSYVSRLRKNISGKE